MNAIQIKFYDLLRKDFHLTDEKAAAFVEVLSEVVELELRKERQSLSTKEDIHRLELKLEQSKTDIYKAIYWTTVVQVLAILGGVLAIVKFVS